MDQKFRGAIWVVDEYLYGEDDHGCTEALQYLSEHPDFDKLPKDIKKLAYERYLDGYFELSYMHGPY